MIEVLLFAALGVIGWSLWVRRDAWRCKWEAAATMTIVFQAAALILTSPIVSTVVGPKLYAITGMWNVEDFFGHTFYMLAAASIVLHALSRMIGIPPRLVQHIVIVLAVSLIVRGVLFVESVGTRNYVGDFFLIQSGPYLAAYWCVLCGVTAYLLLISGRYAVILRQDDRHRRTANIFLCGAVSGITTCAIQMFVAVTGHADIQASTVVWLGCCGGSAGYAWAFGRSWYQRARELVTS